MGTDAFARIDRARPDDVLQLDIDRGRVPMSIGALLVLDPSQRPTAQLVRATLLERAATIPRLGQRMTATPFGAGRPVWLDAGAAVIDGLVDERVAELPAGDGVEAHEAPGGGGGRLPGHSSTRPPTWSWSACAGTARSGGPASSSTARARSVASPSWRTTPSPTAWAGSRCSGPSRTVSRQIGSLGRTAPLRACRPGASSPGRPGRSACQAFRAPRAAGTTRVEGSRGAGPPAATARGVVQPAGPHERPPTARRGVRRAGGRAEGRPRA